MKLSVCMILFKQLETKISKCDHVFIKYIKFACPAIYYLRLVLMVFSAWIQRYTDKKENKIFPHI